MCHWCGGSIVDYMNIYFFTQHMFRNNMNILDLIIITKLEKSKSEVRRLVKGNAVKKAKIRLTN